MEQAASPPGPLPVPEGLERRLQARLLDVLIRAGLLAALVLLCYRVFSPFLTLMAWALILAVALYPLQQRLARRLGERQGLASALLIVLAIAVIVVPTALLMNSFGDSVRSGIRGVQQNTLEIPPPKERVRNWPVVGPRVYDLWTQAHSDLPGLVESLQPKIGELARRALALVARIGVDLLLFLASLILAGIIMAYGRAGAGSSVAIFGRLVGSERGEHFAALSTATVRTVAQGVLGVAFIQSMIIGLILLVAGVPGAGILSIVALILAIAQVPTVLVTIPAIIYLWSSGQYGSVLAILYTVLLLLAGLIDNALKPLLLGRGVDAPMPVVLLGALGGMASDGILGMFVGATLLTMGYQLFMGWVSIAPDAPAPPSP
ncbi:MAG TPA: AI-2E family transporter [Planctomycetota bacterium]|nr:AI-2E family transporter [Planctomycetota bacterium]